MAGRGPPTAETIMARGPVRRGMALRMSRLAMGVASVLALLAVLAGCIKPLPPTPAVMPDQGEPVRFVVVGDTGTGNEPQYEVAAAIGRVCEAKGCDFLVHTGDIIYDVGPRSVDDEQFEVKFERPYGSLGLPVYLTLGNHDVGGDPSDAEDLERWQRVGDLNVAYGQRVDRPSDSWRMPARSYAFEHGTTAFLALDTTAFVYEPLETDQDGPVHRAVAAQEELARTAWPANATWRFAVGHHPYVSNGDHGNAGTYDSDREELRGHRLKAFFEEHVCGQVDVILAGHDHDLQWLAPVDSCGGTRFLISGAGARPRPIDDAERNEAIFQRGATLGFWWLEANGPRLRLIAFDGDGLPMYAQDWRKLVAEASGTGTPASPRPPLGP